MAARTAASGVLPCAPMSAATPSVQLERLAAVVRGWVEAMLHRTARARDVVAGVPKSRYAVAAADVVRLLTDAERPAGAVVAGHAEEAWRAAVIRGSHDRDHGARSRCGDRVVDPGEVCGVDGPCGIDEEGRIGGRERRGAVAYGSTRRAPVGVAGRAGARDRRHDRLASPLRSARARALGTACPPAGRAHGVACAAKRGRRARLVGTRTRRGIGARGAGITRRASVRASTRRDGRGEGEEKPGQAPERHPANRGSDRGDAPPGAERTASRS